MKGAILILVLALSLAVAPAEESSVVAQAAAPLAEGVPEVAVVRLRAALSAGLPPAEQRLAGEKLAEALIAAGKPDEALELLQKDPATGGPMMPFLRAQACAALERWNEALPLYESIAQQASSPLRPEATYGAAEALRALGRADEAASRLKELINDPKWKIRAQLRLAEIMLDRRDVAGARRVLLPQRPVELRDRKLRRFLIGRSEMLIDRVDRALGSFEAIVKRPKGATHSLIIAALFEAADAHLRLGNPQTGDDLLEDFIERHPADVDLPRVFAKLDELYRAERKPIRRDLEGWARSAEEPRRSLARWSLAKIELRANRRDSALEYLRQIRAAHPNDPAIAPALLDLAELSLESRPAEALPILQEAAALRPDPAMRERIEMMIASAQWRSQAITEATATYERIGYSPATFREAALFNAALGRLQLGDSAHFAADYNALEQGGGADAASRTALRLQEGLSLAARRDPRGTTVLQEFVRQFPADPRVSEAFVALAELAFHRAPPAVDDARRLLARAEQTHPTAAATERGDYLGIWLEDAVPNNDDKVIDRANRFLQAHIDSPLARDVRLKLAETYYRRQDFASAQTQFELLAQAEPSGPLGEKALFFAAESAAASIAQNALDRAVVLFDEVVQRKGELRWAARNAQASLERNLGKPREALLLHDEVLRSDARPSDKREALCGKGDVYLELATQDPTNYDRAIEAYEALAADAHEPGHWHNQALFKKGLCLEKKGDRDGALATFYSVIESQLSAGHPPEFFWFYKAGFSAARLLEDVSKWEPAAAIYQRLADAGGPRSDEAKARLERLRLEHFLWEQ